MEKGHHRRAGSPRDRRRRRWRHHCPGRADQQRPDRRDRGPDPHAVTVDDGAPGKAGRADKAGRDFAKHILGRVKDFQHAEWVTKGDGNTYVTHEAILGEVTAVSSTSITVKSTDGTSMTFAVTADTKVRQRQKGSTTTPTIADIATGQTVLVGGEKSPDLTATNIVARAS